jgi:hypothetical protein
MGWVESPPYFCTASETARDVATWYVNSPVGQLPPHPFLNYSTHNGDVQQLPPVVGDNSFHYFVEVYVDDFIPMVIATSQEQVQHVANAVMTGIHDVFPPAQEAEEDSISLKKLRKGDGAFALQKDVLGFVFSGDKGKKTMQLEEPKREFLLAVLKKWLRAASTTHAGIVFTEFESIMAKVRHAFTAIPSGRGLFTPFNNLLPLQPAIVYLHRNKALTEAISDCRTLLRESTKTPTCCSELVMGEPDFIGVKDASIHGVGGIIVGHKKACVPTVFRMECPLDIKAEVLRTNMLQRGRLTNSDLEMAGLLLLFLIMETVCELGPGCHVALFSNNAPTVHWVRRMAAKGSRVAGQLLRALTLRLKTTHVSPLTPLHIAGTHNAMTDIPSRSFGIVKQWRCATDSELLTLFNYLFPLPTQNSWTVFRPSSAILTRVISVLRMQVSTMDEWRRPPKPGQHIGQVGRHMSDLWEWTLTLRESPSNAASDASQVSRPTSDTGAMVEDERSRATRYQRRSRPLARRCPWSAMQIPSNK